MTVKQEPENASLESMMFLFEELKKLKGSHMEILGMLQERQIKLLDPKVEPMPREAAVLGCATIIGAVSAVLPNLKVADPQCSMLIGMATGILVSRGAIEPAELTKLIEDALGVKGSP